MYGELSDKEIEDVLNAGVVGRIGYRDGDDVFIAPVAYVFDGLAVYFYSALGHKIEAMVRDQRVCFEVDEIDGLSNWRSVVGHGNFEQLRGERSVHALQMLSDRIAPIMREETHDSPQDGVYLGFGLPPAVADQPPSSLVEGGIFRIVLLHRSGRFEKR